MRSIQYSFTRIYTRSSYFDSSTAALQSVQVTTASLSFVAVALFLNALMILRSRNNGISVPTGESYLLRVALLCFHLSTFGLVRVWSPARTKK